MRINYSIQGELCMTPCPANIVLGVEPVMMASKYCGEHCQFCKKVPHIDAIDCSHPSITHLKMEEK